MKAESQRWNGTWQNEETHCWNKHRKCARRFPNTFLSWKHKLQRWRRNNSWKNGHGRLWPNRLRPNRIRLVLCVWVFVCVLCAWVLVSRFHGGGFTCGCWFQNFGLVMFGAPGTTALNWTALPRNCLSPGPPKISLFFSLSRRKIRFLLSSLGGLLVEFWWCLKDGTLKCARLGSRAVVWSPGGLDHSANTSRIVSFSTSRRRHRRAVRICLPRSNDRPRCDIIGCQ